VTAWGLAPARGRLHFCGTCGATIAFAEERRPGKVVDTEAERITLATQAHLSDKPLCQSGGTFQGGEIVACRCPRSVLVQREDGLYCARCEGLIAPQVAPVSQPRARSGGAR
jgi:hypothetical protein